MSNVIVGVFPIHLIDLNNTTESLTSYGFPYEKITEIIHELHRSSRNEKYLLFINRKGNVHTTHDYPTSLNEAEYVTVNIKSWSDFQAKANLLGSI